LLTFAANLPQMTLLMRLMLQRDCAVSARQQTAAAVIFSEKYSIS
jgi:hypothetical protein